MKKNFLKYLQFLNPILKRFNVRLPAYYWGLYPCNDNEVENQKELWNHQIAKNPNQNISFNELKTQIIEKSKAEHKDLIENLEKKYGKQIDKIDDLLISEKLSFMRDNFNLEKKRQNSLDHKFTQIIGQSSIVIVIVSIVIPIVNDKFQFNTDQWWFVGLIALIGIITIGYLLSSIYISINNSKTRGYSRLMHNVILNHMGSSVRNFQVEQLVTLYDSTNTNIEINSIKADKVNLAYSRFIKGLIAFIFVSLLATTYIMLNPKDKTKNIKISNQIELSEVNKELNLIRVSLNEISKKNEITELENQLQEVKIELQRLKLGINNGRDSTAIQDL